MAEYHLIEIQQQQQTLFAAIQHHPLSEISASPGHLLLLKLWQREESHLAGRIGAQEIKLDAIKREAFKLCSFFFFFNGIFLTLLFTSSISQTDKQACHGWLVPGFISLVTSLVLIFSVQIRICSYWKIFGKLQREKGQGRALARCVKELRMKGASFDLSKEPPNVSNRMKSSSVKVNWKPMKWLSRNAVTICLVCFSGLVFPACKFILCG